MDSVVNTGCVNLKDLWPLVYAKYKGQYVVDSEKDLHPTSVGCRAQHRPDA